VKVQTLSFMEAEVKALLEREGLPLEQWLLSGLCDGLRAADGEEDATGLLQGFMGLSEDAARAIAKQVQTSSQPKEPEERQEPQALSSDESASATSQGKQRRNKKPHSDLRHGGNLVFHDKRTAQLSPSASRSEPLITDALRELPRSVINCLQFAPRFLSHQLCQTCLST